MGKFEREVLAGEWPMLSIDPTSPWIDREPIETDIGSAAIFHGDGGYEGEQKRARAMLKVGVTYTVARADIGASHTSIELAERLGHWFNSVLFEAPNTSS